MLNRFAKVSLLYSYPALVGIEPDHTSAPRPFLIEYLFRRGEAGAVIDFTNTGALFKDGAASQPATDLADPVKSVLDQSGNGTDAASAIAWLLRRDTQHNALRDGGGTFKVVLPDIGSNATVAYVDGVTGVTILTGQTVSGEYSLPTSDQLGAVIIIDRPLTQNETTIVTKWLNTRRPGNWILGLGAWDDSGVWEDGAQWQTAA